MRAATAEGETRLFFGNLVEARDHQHLGSARLRTDEEGLEVESADYQPFGELWSESGEAGENPWDFAGHRTDADSGLVYSAAALHETAVLAAVHVQLDAPGSRTLLSRSQAFPSGRYQMVANLGAGCPGAGVGAGELGLGVPCASPAALPPPGTSAGSTSPWRRHPTVSNQVCAPATSGGSRTRGPAIHRFQPSNHRADEASSSRTGDRKQEALYGLYEALGPERCALLESMGRR